MDSILSGLALAYIYQLTEGDVAENNNSDGLALALDLDEIKYSDTFLTFLRGFRQRRLPSLTVMIDIFFLAYTVFNASRSFKYLLYYISIALFANVAHQAENQRKLSQLLAHCCRTAAHFHSFRSRFENVEPQTRNSSLEITTISRNSSTLNPIRDSVNPSVPSTNGLLYAQNLAACLVFYYQERLFFLYACLRLDGSAVDQVGRKGKGNEGTGGGRRGGPVSGFLSVCFAGSAALGTVILTPLFLNSEIEILPWSEKIFLFGFFALQQAFFWSSVAVCSLATGWLHRSGRLLYSAQSILRPRANVVAFVAKLKLMTRFELVHTRRPFAFRMLWRSVAVRRELIYEVSWELWRFKFKFKFIFFFGF